ncbi:MAG: thioredoxin-dependent thiol peroxidase [Bacteroidia bacterium]|jgi:peroxiredoxin Q/BCP
MTKLKAGDRAPEFTGLTEKNTTISLSDFKGKKLVLYFYPRDNTPGCTIESCNLRDHYASFIKQGYEILGVSPDSVKKHQNFIRKFELPFSLLADTDLAVCNLYGVWGDKKLFGVSYQGVIRTTFVINENGIIDKIIDEVKTSDHANQILTKE